MDNYLTYNFSDKLTALVGLNLVFSSFNSFTIPFGETSFSQDVSEEEANFDIIDPYLNLVYQTNFGLHINAGARVNIHSVYDTNVVYNLNPSYAIDFGNTTLKFLSSYSTAYITPSLFQLYDPLYGNEELQPEEDRTIEGGIAFFTGKDFRISAVYFNRNEMNYVDFVTVDPDLFIFQYRNIDEEFETNGFEVELYKQLTEQIDFSANYTNTQADERFALRIPEHKINADLTYDIMPNTSIGVQFQFNSERTDSFFNPTTFENETITLDSYSLTDVNFSSQLSATIRVFANVSNIFNTEYEELYRFQTLGRNVRIGFTISL